jgi:hypothetical protein
LVLSLSAVVLLAALTFLLLRFAGLRTCTPSSASCSALLASALGPYIRDATRAAARLLAGLDL